MRDQKGRWQKGASGNPEGRTGQATKLRAMLGGDDCEEVVRQVLTAAKGGDMTAARLILERLVPAVKPSHAHVEFDLDREAPLATQGRAILAAVSEGRLAPDIGALLLQHLAGLARIIEIDEIEARLVALETATDAPR